MILLIIATIVHMIPSFGIGVDIAAVIRLFVVALLFLGWVKSAGVIMD